MKKILVAALLGVSMSASALSGNEDFYPDGDINLYLTIEKGLYPKRACDEPQSQACKIETEKNELVTSGRYREMQWTDKNTITEVWEFFLSLKTTY